MIPLMIVVIASITLLLILYLLTGRRNAGKDIDELAAQLRPLDVAAFRNLIDEREEGFLRERLPARQFRSIHRERMLAATEYVWAAARNAGILIRLAEIAKTDTDPAVVDAAENLLQNAVALRLYAFQTIPRLYLSMAVPSLSHAPRPIADRYGAISRQMTTLRCISSAGRSAYGAV